MLNTSELIESTAQISGNISALPYGIIRHPKPLSNNHYVLQTGNNIEPAVELSWHILQKKIANKDPDKPLIIASLQEHTTDSHMLFQAKILQQLADHQKESSYDPALKFMYAQELPYNYLYEEKPQGIPEEYKYMPDIYDPDNHILMDYLMNSNVFPVEKMLFQTCLENRIKTCFNDVASIEHGDISCLDPNDPITAEIAEKNHNIILQSHRLISCEERDGMSIRNDVMATLALSKAKKLGIGIIFKEIGYYHGGYKTKNTSPYKKSYLTSCREKGAEVTSIFFSLGNGKTAENVIPKQALLDDPGMIIIDGMPDKWTPE